MAELLTKKMSCLIGTLEWDGWNQSFAKKGHQRPFGSQENFMARKFTEKIRNIGAALPLESCIFISRMMEDHSLEMPWQDDLWSPF